MRNLYKSFFRVERVILSIALLLSLSSPVLSQVGFDNPDPDSSALIDMKARDKGLLIPRMTTVDRDAMTANGKKPANALMVYDETQKMFFMYDTITVPNRWVAMNPWISQGIANPNITTATSGNVGIGTTGAPTEKLEVIGNIKSTGNVASVTTTVTGNISAGNMTSTGTITGNTFVGNGTIPIGGIIMWSGTTPPSGWALCNGVNVNGITTPDLRGRFIVGYDPTRLDYDNPGNRSNGGTTVSDVGGEEKHALSISEMPRHNHIISVQTVGHNHGGTVRIDQTQPGGTTYTNFAGGDGNQSPGDGLAHENRPPFYTLAFIIRIQ